MHPKAHTHTLPRLIVAVMGRVSSNGTDKCPGGGGSLHIDRMWESWEEELGAGRPDAAERRWNCGVNSSP